MNFYENTLIFYPKVRLKRFLLTKVCQESRFSLDLRHLDLRQIDLRQKIRFREELIFECFFRNSDKNAFHLNFAKNKSSVLQRSGS